MRRELTQLRMDIVANNQHYWCMLDLRPEGWIRMIARGRDDRYMSGYCSGTDGHVCSSFAEAFDVLVVDLGRVWGVNVDVPLFWDRELSQS